MRFGRVFFLLAVPISAQVVSLGCPQVFLDTSSVFHQLKDIVGGELAGTSRNAGEKKMLGTFVVGNPCLVPFILRMTFDNGGAFGMERWGRKSLIHLRSPELRYRDRNSVSLTRKFSRPVPGGGGGRGGYVYELEFLKEDMQLLYDMELWSFVDEQEAKRAAGGVYRETIQFEIESQYFRADKDTTENTGEADMKKRRRRW